MKNLIFIPLLFLTVASYAIGLKEFSQKIASLDSIAIVIEEEKTISVLNETIKGYSIIYASKASQLRWETFEPYKSIMILNGTDISKYEFLDKKWTLLKKVNTQVLQNTASRIAKIIIGDCSDYNVTDTPNGVELTPKNNQEAKFISKIKVVFNKKTSHIKTIEIIAKDGDSSLLKFVRIKENPDDFKEAISKPINFKSSLE